MMQLAELVCIPRLVRVKPGALDRIGIYLERHALARVALLVSEGLPATIEGRFTDACGERGIDIDERIELCEASFEGAATLLDALPATTQAVVGLGGGKALDVAKYVAHLARRPFFALPTSLSNDGFASPQSSLTLAGRRRSLPSAMPFAVVVDTAVCLAAPDPLWWSGVGDLVAKVTAIADWKLAFHTVGTPVHDFAALLSDATVYQFMARPERDLDGTRLLATALMLNGFAMAIAGSSRPASGGEHLISHALDAVSARPRLHGLQVGVATYLISRLQGQGTERIDHVLERCGFWDGVAADPFDRDEWIEALRLAPTLRPGYVTVLSSRDCLPEAMELLERDARLSRCVVGRDGRRDAAVTRPGSVDR
ncbi:MAG: iron-containing alcohol dehydrogenase family protein [Candidatus Eiseniibacteriota bacterium]|jgi:glycerol-1-phosphate dehydrogenase [NAD(P)+]